jgi:hypothetical protein
MKLKAIKILAVKIIKIKSNLKLNLTKVNKWAKANGTN